MSERHHHAVVAIVTNAARSRFFVQQKDEDYRPFPLGYSLFGGAREPGEALERALVRELHEELGAAAQRLVDAGAKHVLDRELAAGFMLSLFEIVLEEPVLASLDEIAVLEGKRGVLLDRATLEQTPLIWGLDEVVLAYLEHHPHHPR